MFYNSHSEIVWNNNIISNFSDVNDTENLQLSYKGKTEIKRSKVVEEQDGAQRSLN